jgi:hypothetical protein
VAIDRSAGVPRVVDGVVDGFRAPTVFRPPCRLVLRRIWHPACNQGAGLRRPRSRNLGLCTSLRCASSCGLRQAPCVQSYSAVHAFVAKLVCRFQPPRRLPVLNGLAHRSYSPSTCRHHRSVVPRPEASGQQAEGKRAEGRGENSGKASGRSKLTSWATCGRSCTSRHAARCDESGSRAFHNYSIATSRRCSCW